MLLCCVKLVCVVVCVNVVLLCCDFRSEFVRYIVRLSRSNSFLCVYLLMSSDLSVELLQYMT